jgi:hypothetical protein
VNCCGIEFILLQSWYLPATYKSSPSILFIVQLFFILFFIIVANDEQQQTEKKGLCGEAAEKDLWKTP